MILTMHVFVWSSSASNAVVLGEMNLTKRQVQEKI